MKYITNDPERTWHCLPERLKSTSKEAKWLEFSIFSQRSEEFLCDDGGLQGLIDRLTEMKEEVSKLGYTKTAIEVMCSVEDDYGDLSAECLVVLVGGRYETPAEIDKRCSDTQAERDAVKDKKKRQEQLKVDPEYQLSKVATDASALGFECAHLRSEVVSEGRGVFYNDDYSICLVEIVGQRLETPEETEKRCTKAQKRLDKAKAKKTRKKSEKKALLADPDYQKLLELKKKFKE